MRLRWPITEWKWLLIVPIAIALLASTALWTRRQSELVIDHRPVGYWIDALDHDGNREANNKLLHAGPTALPPLIAALQDQKGIGAKLRGMIAKGGQPVHWWLGKIIPPEVARREIEMMISEIANQQRVGPDGPEIRAAVESLTREINKDPRNATRNIVLLSQFGEHAQNAVPTLIDFVRSNCPPKTAQLVLYAFSEIGSATSGLQVATFATSFLTSTNPAVRFCAIKAIGGCGPAGKISTQALMTALNGDWAEQSRLYAATLALIGEVPAELKPRLAEQLEHSSGPAAVAMLEIDPKEPTALNIVQSRLHPLAGNDHTEMIQLVSRVPTVARLFIPELQKLARKTNAPTSVLARQTLRRLATETN